MSETELNELLKKLNASCRGVGGSVYADKSATVRVTGGVGGDVYAEKNSGVSVTGGIGGSVFIYDEKSKPDVVKQRQKEFEQRKREREKEREQRQREKDQRQREKEERQLQKEKEREQREKDREQNRSENKSENDDDDDEPFPSYCNAAAYIITPLSERKHSFENLNGRYFEPFELNGVRYDANRIISGLDDARRTQILSNKDDLRSGCGYPRSMSINGVKLTKKELDADALRSAQSMLAQMTSK